MNNHRKSVRVGKPIVTAVEGGELSTVELPSGIVETIFFPDDPMIAPTVVNRSSLRAIMGYHRDDLALWRYHQEESARADAMLATSNNDAEGNQS